jgi:hypothetical protein
MKWLNYPLLLLPLCTPAGASSFLDQDAVKAWVDKPTPNRFAVCFNHTCAETAVIGVTKTQWQKVRALFAPKAKSANEERRRIARAIALMERIVGPKIGTQNDKSRNFEGTLAEGNQQDCIDESTNTTTYLTMMEQDHLLHFHTVQETATRGWFIMGMPHTSAVIREDRSGIDYAVDSWFHDNGVEPEILTVEEWWKQWYPKTTKHR